LQKRDSFYLNFGKELIAATKTATQIDGKPFLEFMDELVPSYIASRILDMSRRVDALAIVTMDHPQVNQAIEEVTASGKPVFSLLSHTTSMACTGHLGVDSRKCGRIAGWTICHMAKKAGKIGILVGSHRYLNQELSEISFRTYMREHAPQFQLLEPIINLDDERIAYEAVSDMIDSIPDLVAIYVSGGGQDGFIRALRERAEATKLIAICNEFTESTKSALLDNTVVLTLATPIAAISARLVDMVAKACASPALPHFPQIMLPPNIHISENI
jgi:LacI family transcriptional regulator